MQHGNLFFYLVLLPIGSFFEVFCLSFFFKGKFVWTLKQTVQLFMLMKKNCFVFFLTEIDIVNNFRCLFGRYIFVVCLQAMGKYCDWSYCYNQEYQWKFRGSTSIQSSDAEIRPCWTRSKIRGYSWHKANGPSFCCSRRVN